MSGAARQGEMADEAEFLLTGTEGPAGNGLKQAVAERLAAHRNRRAAEQTAAEENEVRARARAERARSESRRGASMVKDAVAARYRESQSYREFLAAEAERALQQAQAEAEVATRTMRAVAEAQQKLLDELAAYDSARPASEGPQLVIAETQPTKGEIRAELAHELADIVLGAKELIAEPVGLSIVEQFDTPAQPDAPAILEEPAVTKAKTAAPVPGMQVKLAADLSAQPRLDNARRNRYIDPTDAEDAAELEREIAFRRAPEFESMTLEINAIPANIIEFPRQLIAPRKARPRLAEGPLLEEGGEVASGTEPQLRIFEVEANQITFEPEPVAAPLHHGAPEWQSLLLERYEPADQPAPQDAQASFTFQPDPASLQRRLLAVAVDGLCVATAFLFFATAVGYIAGPALAEAKLSVLAGASALVLAAFYLAFQTLFFTLSNATPGMRYARIALCTFGDDNPSRKAMRRRTWANLLALCPLGLGFAWILMDNDRLGWHDRISRMYQRAY